MRNTGNIASRLREITGSDRLVTTSRNGNSLSLTVGGGKVTHRVSNPQRAYATELARRISALRQFTGAVSPAAQNLPIQIVLEIARQWTACYFAPMMTLNSNEKESAEEDGEISEVRNMECLSRPKKGLRLPLVFALREKRDHAGLLASSPGSRKAKGEAPR